MQSQKSSKSSIIDPQFGHAPSGPIGLPQTGQDAIIPLQFGHGLPGGIIVPQMGQDVTLPQFGHISPIGFKFPHKGHVSICLLQLEQYPAESRGVRQ